MLIVEEAILIIEQAGVMTRSTAMASSRRHKQPAHYTGMGRRHTGTPVVVLDQHVRIITTSGRPLRDFQLNPDRDYQPQSKHPSHRLEVFTLTQDIYARGPRTSHWWS